MDIKTGKVNQMKTTLATLTGDEKKKQAVKIQKFTKILELSMTRYQK